MSIPQSLEYSPNSGYMESSDIWVADEAMNQPLGFLAELHPAHWRSVALTPPLLVDHESGSEVEPASPITDYNDSAFSRTSSFGERDLYLERQFSMRSTAEKHLRRSSNSLSRVFPRKWPLSFYTHKAGPFQDEHEPWAQTISFLDSPADDLRIFLEDEDELGQLGPENEVMAYVKSYPPNTAERCHAWLDDRCFHPDPTKAVRRHANSMTHQALQADLSVKRFADSEFQDADRRLIHITNLSPGHIKALTTTATSHQKKTIKDIIVKHINAQISIQVKIPADNFEPVFRMEVHIPIYMLETVEPHKQEGPPRKWIDLSFLIKNNSHEGTSKTKGISVSHISFALCGPSNTQWTALCFVDDFDAESDNDEDVNDMLDPDTGDFEADPFMTHGNLDAGVPIWDARLYFLRVFESRVSQTLIAWKALVWWIEKNVKEHDAGQIFSRSIEECFKEKRDLKEAVDRMFQTSLLLGRLRGVLTETIEEWQRFKTGDIFYFADMASGPRRTQGVWLLKIEELFNEMAAQRSRLISLEDHCHRQSKVGLYNSMPSKLRTEF
ncbi:hypothetical protein BT63DRAFT_44003 [Microthyrium microscopicum]|uniref:Uncharacterized protein n=1 Tax=Microthyrium microscopicum TaxID=703497 RepID=A0A6A6U1X3_9PEZI|nr:hypothetical protein BT63DRAFT_44003 [Microthyrium microscopicum]